MSLTARKLTDDEWTIAILGRLAFLLRIHAEPTATPGTGTELLWTNEFRDRGLLDDHGPKGQLKLSNRGAKLIEMVLDTPLPCHVWTDPRKVSVRMRGWDE